MEVGKFRDCTSPGKRERRLGLPRRRPFWDLQRPHLLSTVAVAFSGYYGGTKVET